MMPRPAPELQDHLDERRSDRLPFGLHPVLDTMILVGKLCDRQVEVLKLIQAQREALRYTNIALGMLAVAVMLLAAGVILK